MVAERPPVLAGRPARPSELEREDARWLAWHEACAHGLLGREVRDLGDAYLLHDATDREPFWNRIAGIAWPREPAAFDRRLTEAFALFAGLDRIPHVWSNPAFDEPPDLADRLVAQGFDDHGGGLLMVLDPERAFLDDDPPARRDQRDPRERARAGRDESISIERFHLVTGAVAADAAQAIAAVLVESFAVEPERRVAIELETVQALTDPAFDALLVRVDGRPAAVAKRTTFSGASYLSSIGTDPRFRGQGLGRLVTSIAVRDAVADGSRWTYLGVFEENHVAQRLYRSLGFEPVGTAGPDLLLRP
jgi:ribosomal protein S18 acetylase RimI-like enzyme